MLAGRCAHRLLRRAEPGAGTSFGEGLVEDLVPPLGQPDVMNYSWRDWGNRVGAWRLLAMFRELGFAPSLLVNTVLYETARA